MKEEKNTQRSSVHIGFDGRVHKRFRGPMARERYENEVRVLKYLEEKQCPFVPRVLDTNDEELYLVTSNCGQRAEHISDEKCAALFGELEQYRVRHDDPMPRNITYDPRAGRFCVIDFEFATLLDAPHLAPPPPEL